MYSLLLRLVGECETADDEMHAYSVSVARIGTREKADIFGYRATPDSKHQATNLMLDKHQVPSKDKPMAGSTLIITHIVVRRFTVSPKYWMQHGRLNPHSWLAQPLLRCRSWLLDSQYLAWKLDQPFDFPNLAITVSASDLAVPRPITD